LSKPGCSDGGTLNNVRTRASPVKTSRKNVILLRVGAASRTTITLLLDPYESTDSFTFSDIFFWTFSTDLSSSLNANSSVTFVLRGKEGVIGGAVSFAGKRTAYEDPTPLAQTLFFFQEEDDEEEDSTGKDSTGKDSEGIDSMGGA
jgi:hypothetical protein